MNSHKPGPPPEPPSSGTATDRDTRGRTARQLRERIKELHCLYTVSSLAQKTELPVSALFTGTIDALIAGYQYPEVTCPRITLGDGSFQSDGFRESAWRQTATIAPAGRAEGTLEVFYTETRPPEDDGPFLREEQALLDTVAQIIGRSLEERRERTARRETEERLRRSEQEFRTLSENSPDIVTRFDRALRHLYVNPVIEKFTGRTRESFIGRTNAELGMPAEHVAVWDAALRQVFESGRARTLDFSFPSPAGECFFESLLVPEPGPDGKVRTVLGVVHDITEHKRAEERLRRFGIELEAKNAQLARLVQRLEESNTELDKFTYVVSHDLKAPLRAVHSLSSWIEEEAGRRLTDDGRRRIRLLRQRVRHMDELIDALLAYAHAGAHPREPEEVDIGEVLADIITELDIPEGFHVVVTPDLPRLCAERTTIRQVFAQLIGNAVEHSGRPDGHVWVSAQALGDYYEFMVRDDGPGIPPQYHERVFEMFQRLDARKNGRGGTGIGLALVKKLVENVGGRIRLESDTGRGSVFRFTWPARLNVATE